MLEVPYSILDMGLPLGDNMCEAEFVTKVTLSLQLLSGLCALIKDT